MFISFFVLFLFIFINGTEEKQALIFDRYTRSLIQLPANVPNDMECGAWAIACPAETEEEKDFAKENSFTNNALFVREIYDRGDKASKVKRNVCKDSFKISLAYNIKSFTFQVGFEIFYKLKDAGFFHTNNFEDYKSPVEVASSMTTTLGKAKYVGKEYYRVAKNVIGSDVKELWINKNERMGFVWIYLFKFEFDLNKKILKKSTYDIGPNSRWPVIGEQCEEESLGSEFYEDIDKRIFFQTEETFKNFKFPRTFTCKSNAECLKKWSIVPMSQFRFGTSTLPLCSNMAIIPIWKVTSQEYLLKKMDQYLYALYRVIDEPLHITAGIIDEVELSKKWSLGKSTVFVDSVQKKIPVPKIIYKIVEYRVKNCKLEEKSCWYSAVIIIHNHPWLKFADKLCSYEISEEWGWNNLLRRPEEEICNIIYVCPTNILYTKLKLPQISKASADLKLSQFPISNDGVTVIPTDIRRDIVLKFDKFFAFGDELSTDENQMIVTTPGNALEWVNESVEAVEQPDKDA